MFTIVVVVVVVLLVALVGVAATKPDSMHIERKTSIQATPEHIFPLINDFHRWNDWSPYVKKDPGMKQTFGSVTAGKGAVYEWNGNSQIGQGRMELIETAPPSRATIKLDFVRPMEGHNIVIFSLTPSDGQTTVSWAMDAPMPFISKLMSVFINMDTMIGKDFEVGLANLKALSEQKSLR